MMVRLFGLGLLAGGAGLLYFGWKARESVAEQLTEAVTGTPSDDTMMMLVGGGILAMIGLGMLAMGGGKKD